MRRGEASITHGMYGTPIYRVWASMVARCENPKASRYADYGGRGIRVCKRWLKFAAFFKDMGCRPDGMTLDRKNNNKGYSPSNCRWATLAEQARNRSDNVFLNHDGKRLCLKDWGTETGIGWQTIRARVKNGWPISDALTRPVRTQNRRAFARSI